MASAVSVRETLDDLYREEGKAELIGGRIVRYMPTGDFPSDVASNIYVSLRAYAKSKRKGVAKNDGIGFTVARLPSGRESFAPDASYFVGERPTSRMRFIAGAPRLAVEVRSENDYGPAKELEIAAKRADYFAAGTLVVWDVDPIAETVRVYRLSKPDEPVIYRLGDIADAEPAVPGWRISVADVFEE